VVGEGDVAAQTPGDGQPRAVLLVAARAFAAVVKTTIYLR
jgi:hypothetical protein